jgi:hypothetical protein
MNNKIPDSIEEISKLGVGSWSIFPIFPGRTTPNSTRGKKLNSKKRCKVGVEIFLFSSKQGERGV